MKLTILGSGTSVPHPRRASSGYLIETASGTLLLDCSASITSRMSVLELAWHEIDTIWISHFHLDHVGGLPSFLAGTKHAAETRSRTKPLNIYGPRGLRSLIERFSDVNDYRLLQQPFPVTINEIEPLEPFEIYSGVEAVAMDTPHTDESLAIRISDGDKSLVYTADTGFSETLAAFAQQTDLLIIECSFHTDKPAQKHLELAEAMYIIRKASPERAILTHLYPEWDAIDMVAAAEKFSPPCQIIEAQDGLTVSV